MKHKNITVIDAAAAERAKRADAARRAAVAAAVTITPTPNATPAARAAVIAYDAADNARKLDAAAVAAEKNARKAARAATLAKKSGVNADAARAIAKAEKANARAARAAANAAADVAAVAERAANDAARAAAAERGKKNAPPAVNKYAADMVEKATKKRREKFNAAADVAAPMVNRDAARAAAERAAADAAAAVAAIVARGEKNHATPAERADAARRAAVAVIANADAATLKKRADAADAVAAARRAATTDLLHTVANDAAALDAARAAAARAAADAAAAERAEREKERADAEKNAAAVAITRAFLTADAADAARRAKLEKALNDAKRDAERAAVAAMNTPAAVAERRAAIDAERAARRADVVFDRKYKPTQTATGKMLLDIVENMTPADAAKIDKYIDTTKARLNYADAAAVAIAQNDADAAAVIFELSAITTYSVLKRLYKGFDKPNADANANANAKTADGVKKFEYADAKTIAKQGGNKRVKALSAGLKRYIDGIRRYENIGAGVAKYDKNGTITDFERTANDAAALDAAAADTIDDAAALFNDVYTVYFDRYANGISIAKIVKKTTVNARGEKRTTENDGYADARAAVRRGVGLWARYDSQTAKYCYIDDIITLDDDDDNENDGTTKTDYLAYRRMPSAWDVGAADCNGNYTADAETARKMETLEKRVKSLCSATQETILDYRMSGKSLSDIAEKMSVKTPTVCKQAARLREKVLANMSDVFTTKTAKNGKMYVVCVKAEKAE